MKKSTKLNKLDSLTLETDALTKVLEDALKYQECEKGYSDILFLVEIIRQKLSKIRDLF